MSKLLILGLFRDFLGVWRFASHLVALQALSCGEKLRPILVLKKHGGGGETKSARPEAGMMILEPSKH